MRTNITKCQCFLSAGVMEMVKSKAFRLQGLKQKTIYIYVVERYISKISPKKTYVCKCVAFAPYT